MIGFMIRMGKYCLEVDGEKRCLMIEEPVVLSDEDLARAIRYVESENFEELERLLKSLEKEKATVDEIIDITDELEGNISTLADVIDDVMFERLMNDSEVNALMEDVKRNLTSENEFKYIVEKILRESLGKAYDELVRLDEKFLDELFKALSERS